LLATTLKSELKFADVIDRRNLDRRQMADLSDKIGRRAKGADIDGAALQPH